MKIEVLGPGCARCVQLHKNVMEAVLKSNLDADVEKVTDITKIMSYGIMATPAIVIDGKVISTGKVPSVAELQKLLSH